MPSPISGSSTFSALAVGGLLLNLQIVNDGRELAENLECFLVELKLGSDQVS